MTDLPGNRQGSGLVLSLEDEALDAALEIDDEDIAKENGVDAILERLTRLTSLTRLTRLTSLTSFLHQALEALETFRRPESMSIQVL